MRGALSRAALGFALLASPVAWSQIPSAGDPAPSPAPAAIGAPQDAGSLPAPGPAMTPDESAALAKALQQDAGASPGRPSPAAASPAASAAPPIATFGGGAGASLDMAFILDVAGAYYSEAPLNTGGHDPTRTGFTFQGLELAVQANVDPYLRFVATIVMSPFGLEIEEAYGQTLSLPWGFQVRAGQMLTRFGRINATHPHSWSFVDQTLVVGKFLGSEGSRGLGVELSWLAPLPWYLEVVGAATDAAGECCARSFLGGRDLGIHGMGDFLYTVAIKQFFPFGREWSLMWGVSGQFGPNATGNGNRTEIYATDLYLRYKPLGSPERTHLSLTVEGMYRARQVPGDSLRDWGGYAQVAWQFLKRWETGARYEFVSGIGIDPLDPEWTRARHRASAQMTFFPSHFSRIRLQGTCDIPRWRPDPIWGAILNLEMAVGAHGAHSF